MVIYALTLEDKTEDRPNQGCPVALYELEAVTPVDADAQFRKLRLTDRPPTNGGNVFARVPMRNEDGEDGYANDRPPLEMDPEASWLVFRLADGHTATGTTYTIDCYRDTKHTGNYPALRIVRSDGKVMSQNTWISLGAKTKTISKRNEHWNAQNLKTDYATTIKAIGPTCPGIWRIIFIEIKTDDGNNRYLPISFTPWPLCTPAQEYSTENFTPTIGIMQRLTEAMASALKRGVTVETMQS
jgi:hypothetical protein